MTTEKPKKTKEKRIQVKQTDFPQLPIEKSLRIIQALWDQYAGKPTPPHDVALAIGLAPTSGSWRNLTGTSIAYGLTEGGYAAKQIALTPLGKRIVAPIEIGDDKRALIEAILIPKIMKAFYEKYNHGKFPDSNIAENVLIRLGLPKARAKIAADILLENGIKTGILRETQTGYFVALEEPPNNLTDSIIDNSAENQQESPINIPQSVNSKTREKDAFSFRNGLYINFEIHIAADTPVETIETIFRNMRKYLMENE